MNIFRLRKQPDLSGMENGLETALLERMNAPAPDKAKDGLSVSREDLEHTIKRIDAEKADNEAAIGRADAEIARQRGIITGLREGNADLAARRKQAVAAIAVLDKASADLEALVKRASEQPDKPTKRRSRKAEQAEA